MRSLPVLFVLLSTAGCSSDRPDFDGSNNTGGGATESGGDSSGGTTGDGDGSGGTTGDGDGSGGDGDTTCEKGKVGCDGGCVDPSSDSEYCGAAGNCMGDESGEACFSPLSCVDGACALSCGKDEVACGESCVDPSSDDEFCGASGSCTGSEAGEKCESPQSCVEGACALTCGENEVACGDLCIIPSSDEDYCGASGSCTGSDAGEKCVSPENCVDGACALGCGESELVCGDTCVDPKTDQDHCGASGDCTGGNAGQACGSGYACDNGTCKLQCPSTQLACGDSCINPNTDDDFCGASGDCTGGNVGKVCSGSTKCTSGVCRSIDGATCTTNSNCISGKCLTFYEDKDGDGFGAKAIKMCSSTTTPPGGYVAVNGDCCDSADSMALAKLVNPEYMGGPTSTPAAGCAKTFDYNCDGDVTPERTIGRSCSDFNQTGDVCPTTAFPGYDSSDCGDQIIGSACFRIEGVCQNVRGASDTLRCY